MVFGLFLADPPPRGGGEEGPPNTDRKPFEIRSDLIHNFGEYQDIVLLDVLKSILILLMGLTPAVRPGGWSGLLLCSGN